MAEPTPEPSTEPSTDAPAGPPPAAGGARERPGMPWIVVVISALILAGGGVGAVLLHRGTGDVSNPDVAFTTEATDTPQPRRAPRPADWPTYGGDPARTRTDRTDLRPPFRSLWRVGGRVLLEFSPVLADGRLFLLRNDGRLQAIRARDGRKVWSKRIGRLAAASPAVGDGRVFVTFLQARKRRKTTGRVAALSAETGRVLWVRDLPRRTESSPLLHRGMVIFGSEGGKVYALEQATGRIRWTYEAEGDVKAALALDAGRLFFGDYGGRVYALRARDGRQIWKVGTKGASFGLSAGNFYSTPAVRFGRVYLGNTDGRVYSFSAKDGKLAWAKRTGGFVYAAPAVANPRGVGPTVYIGSYDRYLYALDARSGRVRWRTKVGGRISGAATVVGRYVYVSNLDAKSTVALTVGRGRKVWGIGRGAYNPVITDRRRIYLTGYAGVDALEPRTASRERRARPRRSSRERRARGSRERRARPSRRRR